MAFGIEKNVVLYGDLRCCKDFEYIFDNIFEIKIYGDSKKDLAIDVLRNDPNAKFIICSFEKEKDGKDLENLGCDYEFADKYFESIDRSFINISKSKVYIWGAGFWGKKTYEHIKDYITVKAFLDNNELLQNSTVCDIEVLSPESLADEEYRDAFIIVSPRNYLYEIQKILISKGLKKSIDYIGADKLFLSELIKETFYDKTYHDFICESMFRIFEVEATGDISNCCTTLIRTRSGNLLCDEYDEIWNSVVHHVECLSLNNRTFTFCIPTSCPALINRKCLEASDELAEKLVYKKIPQRPEYLHLSIDETCNLYCESCRDCIRISKGEKLEKTILMKEKILNSPLAEVKELYIAGNGEVFLSKIYEDIWKSELANNANTIRVLTNGMLLTPKRWNEFYSGKENVNIWLYVSIDAATKSSYESIRRGGNFDVLKRNMEFASKLRKEGKIQYFRINFVVQRKNFLEMEKFIEWGIELGVDNVFFTKILNWGTYTDEEFDKVSMMEKDNKNPKSELKEILDKPIFTNHIVDIGTIQYKRNRVLPDYVDNYYVWETRDWMERNRKE